ncbi:MAG: mRNA interferase MazF [Saprospiraceae bacterium]|jgi:mRNA interferase MazF
MNKGDIVLVPFPFTDLSNSKTRPCLILIVRDRDITVSFISSQLKNDDYSVLLKPNSQNGLKRTSSVILSKIATLDRRIIIGKIGEINTSETRTVNQKLADILKINDEL